MNDSSDRPDVAGHNSQADERAITDIAGEIMKYLSANPQSSDTLKGIEQWWLQGARYPKGFIQRALDKLVDKGALRCRRGANGEMVYSRSAQERDK